MIKHIVMWKVRGDDAAARGCNLARLRAEFESLRGRIPGLLHLEIGIDESRIDYACDAVLYSEFASREALAAYADHPEHRRVRHALGDLRIARHQVDYRSDPEAGRVDADHSAINQGDIGMAQHQTADITQAVLDRLSPDADPRFKQILTAVVRHAHALAREVDLKPGEWMAAIQFLTRVGQTCDDQRQEFILLSDTLGLSMLVVQLEQARRSAKALADQTATLAPTEATVQGPFYWEGAPLLPLGSDIGSGMPGEPAYYSGRVTDTHGQPIAACCVDVWSGDGAGVYDMQMGGDAGMRLRARFHTDEQGRYRFWSIKPTFYPVPDDGPVGDMLRAMGRHPNRPGHIHMMVYRDGYVPLTTHLFPADSPYLDSDAVFGVRDSLIVPFERYAAGQAPDGRAMDKPFHVASYDFALVPTA